MLIATLPLLCAFFPLPQKFENLGMFKWQFQAVLKSLYTIIYAQNAKIVEAQGLTLYSLTPTVCNAER